MSRSTFFGIEIGRTGLNVSQKGLDVTGHNIANVNTAGYTRQRLVTTAYEPYNAITQFKPVERGLVGSGSHVVILDQIRDQFLDRQYRTEQTLLSYWNARVQGLNYVEALFEGSDDADLNASINELFTAFNAMATEGNDREQRKLVQQTAINLCQNFNLIYDRLIDQQKTQNLSVETVTSQINEICDSIAVLNKSIYSYEMDGQPANDLRDKRNLLLDELSTLIDIEYYEDANDKFVVKTGGGELVNHLNVNHLATRTETDPVTGQDRSIPYWDVGGNDDLIVTGGKLKSHMDLRDNATADTPGIPYFIEQLNNMARALVQEINAIHKQGYTSASCPAGSITGVAFFDESLGLANITAGNLSINSLIAGTNGEYYIAAAEDLIDLTEPVNPGDSEELNAGDQRNAVKIYDLLNKTNIILTIPGSPPTDISIGTLDGFMAGIVLDVAVTLKNAKTMQGTHQINALSADTQRTSISGVSLDEEMTNLIRYQHAYSGASRVITTMDDALDTLINKMGRVGL